MEGRFKTKYRNDKSLRLKNWDYGTEGAYFITIVTKNRSRFFGEIRNGKMQVSPAGAIAHVLWSEIKNHNRQVELGEFVIMPDHVHGILILKGNNSGGGGDSDSDSDSGAVVCNGPTGPENANQLSIHKKSRDPSNSSHHMALISPKQNTVSSIIRSYKSAVTNHCNRLELPCAWQSRFYDHIIRNEQSFHRIAKYIRDNPVNWRQ